MALIFAIIILLILMTHVGILIALMIFKKANKTEMLILTVPVTTSIVTIYFMTQDLLK